MTADITRRAETRDTLGLGMEPWSGAEPRLLALRMQGFKSFAERTSVEFGPGISAVVGPNGSGKSNLADALRWALGEQGRALRSRKSEDVIWAGSDRRPAQGMAEVSLLVDNSDGLLPVEYRVLELGRRLFRSGENDYLLNRTRVRLRELVDLLDAAHLADNAFLFIGQGMVDQALALRPEERRPLFDEVAGVRRHERRRRRAEEQLVESEANLARVEDILGELRPQVRRLAAQAEQQATRQTIADELWAALVSSMHARWFEAAARLAAATSERARAQSETDAARAALGAAEEANATLARERSSRIALERERELALEAATAAHQAARLREARLAAEIEALGRDRDRLLGDHAAAEAERSAAARTLAEPLPARDVELDSALAGAERALATALEELAALRGAQQAHAQEQAAARRAEAARAAELDAARRRVGEAERRLADAEQQATTTHARLSELQARHAIAAEALAAAASRERDATERRAGARARAAAAEASAAAASEAATVVAATVAGLRGEVEALGSRLDEEERRGIAVAARRAGGRRLDDDLVVDPPFRAAVEAVLSDAVRAYVVGRDAVARLAAERGTLIVAERTTREAGPLDAPERRFRDAVIGARGGFLESAVQHDPSGAARRALARTAWLPDLAACLTLQPDLPPGWILVTRDGRTVVSDIAVTLGSGDGTLERRAAAERLRRRLADAEAELGTRRAAADAAAMESAAAADALEAARAEEHRAIAEHRAAEGADRQAARELETALRDAAWNEAQRERVAGELARSRDALDAMGGRTQPELTALDGAATPEPVDRSAAAAWEARAQELRSARDRLAAQVATADAAQRDAGHRRARAEAAVANAEARLEAAGAELTRLGARAAEFEQARATLQHELAGLEAREASAREALAAVRATDAADRERALEAEQATMTARERLRTADDRLRLADHHEVEARLGIESLREAVLVELEGLGDLAVSFLGALATAEAVGDGPAIDSDDSDQLVRLLEPLTRAWAATRPSDTAPSAARLGQLRRRFHDLGAVNASAIDEYETQRTRLEALEAQAADLTGAIGRTRELIRELDVMIGDRFETTFRALESAFAARFEQLFGGGFARLSLTDPADIGASGIEIVARPPGKKPQALAMLSGGERALTAVALLFAMLEVRPVPFCVLDEVDAALDEANIGRFADALRSLADRTQFIVITHNRGTIEAADALYGVTSGDDSVSRVISLRLDEARAIAASRSAGNVAAG